MSYDDWKTTDPSAAEHCDNGRYHCQSRCPVCKECVDSCAHSRDDIDPPPSDQDVRAALVEVLGKHAIYVDQNGEVVHTILADPLLGKLLRGGR